MLHELASALGITEIPESWKRNYADAVECRPMEINFLQENHLDKIGKRILLSEKNALFIREAMETIRTNEQLQLLAWLWHYILYLRVDPAREKLTDWPAPTGSFDADKKLEGVFPAVVLLSGYDRLERMHNERHIPEHIILDSLASLDSCMNAYRNRSGHPGLGMFYFQWMQLYFNAKLYRIGRLNFEMRAFANPIKVFQNIHDGTIVALSDDGVKYRGDGLVEGTNDIFDESGGWEATFTETMAHYQGYPIHKDGYVLKNQVVLNKMDWRKTLSPGDPVISIHIPGKGPFTYDICRDSFIRARDFFAAYYADLPYNAMYCVSWLLDPQLQQLLDESSNLVQFMKWFHLFPVKSNDSGLYFFVFKCEKGNIDELPEKTSLQRKLKQFMKSGGHMHNGGGFILPETFERLTSSIIREKQ